MLHIAFLCAFVVYAKAVAITEETCKAFESHCRGMKRFDVVEHRTRLIVNQHVMQGVGVGNANEGRLSSEMYLPDALKDNVELLAPFAIVGYPTYSEYKEGATDLFKPSSLNGGYMYERHYELSNGMRFDSHHDIVYNLDSQQLAGNFTTTNFPEDLPGNWRVGDFIETFMPGGDGKIKSMMVVEWNEKEGAQLVGIINSTYYLKHGKNLPKLHWRHVQFMNEHEDMGKLYRQSEKLTVVSSFDYGAPKNVMSLKDNHVIL